MQFVGDVSNQSFAPGLGLALFLRRHGGVAGTEVLTDDMGTGEIIQEAADAPPANDPMQSIIHLGIDCNGKLLVRLAATGTAGSTRQTIGCSHSVLALFRNL